MTKRLTALILAALMIIGLSGCKNSNTKKTDAGDTTKASSEATKATDATEKETEGETSLADTLKPEDYSYGFDDNGYLTGIKALDYVKVPDFSALVYKKSDLEPTEEQIQSDITKLVSYFTYQDKESEVKKGDSVNISYVGKIDGVAFDGGSTGTSGADVVAGATNYIDDFLDQIIGHKPGETFDVNVTFPDSYPQNTSLQGKDAVFETTINYITATPEFNDAFVTQYTMYIGYLLGDYSLTTAQEVHDWFHDYYYYAEIDEKLETDLYDKLEITIPDQVMAVMKHSYEISIIESYDMTLEDYMSQGQVTEENLQKQLVSTAKQVLLFQALAETQGYSPDDNEIKEYLGDNFEEYTAVLGKGYICQYVIFTKESQVIYDSLTIE